MSLRAAQTQKVLEELHAELKAAYEGSEYEYDSDFSGTTSTVDFKSVPSSLQQSNFDDLSSSDDETDDAKFSVDTPKTIYFQTRLSTDTNRADFLKGQLSSKFYAMNRKEESAPMNREAGGGLGTSEISGTKKSFKKFSVKASSMKKSQGALDEAALPPKPLSSVPSMPHFMKCQKTCWVPEVRIGSTIEGQTDLFYQKATLAYLRTRALCREKLRCHKPQPRRKRKRGQYNTQEMLTCKFCLKEFQIKSLLDAHKLSHEPGKHELGRQSTQDLEPTIIIRKPKPKCEYCDKTFALEFMLRIHQMKYCLRIPLPIRRTLEFAELEHQKPPPVPIFMPGHKPKTRGSILRPTKLYPSVELE